MPPLPKDLVQQIAASQEAWLNRPDPGVRTAPAPGQISVWDFPRPPLLESVPVQVKAIFAGTTVASSARCMRVCETASAPTYYFPPDDVRMDCLTEAEGYSLCEWKGIAAYWDLQRNGQLEQKAVWAYPEPLPGFEAIAGWLAFMPGALDEAWVGDMPVTPQPGGFYGGWVTPDLAGPIKGGPGTGGW